MGLIENKIALCARKTSLELERYFAEKDEDSCPVFDAMQYSVASGGKRIRPFLVHAFSECFGGRRDEASVYACALEMIHTYSLIHDDLPCMDDDDLRRGNPTCHKVYGEATALLAGDALLTYAFEIVADSSVISDKNKVRAVSILSRCSGRYGMIGGQQIDLLGEIKPMTYELMAKMHTLKTGALINAACLLGCLSADIYDDNILNNVSCYAEGIGRVFQLVDDILDITSTDEELGKPTHSDEKNMKTTYMSFMTVEMAAELAHIMTEKACLAVEEYDRNGILKALAEYLRDRKK